MLEIFENILNKKFHFFFWIYSHLDFLFIFILVDKQDLPAWSCSQNSRIWWHLFYLSLHWEYWFSLIFDQLLEIIDIINLFKELASEFVGSVYFCLFHYFIDFFFALFYEFFNLLYA